MQGAPGFLDSLLSRQRVHAFVIPFAVFSRPALQRVTEVYNQARARLEDPDVGAEEAPVLIVFLSELAAEKLPGTREEDPMRLYLDSIDEHMEQYVQVKLRKLKLGGVVIYSRWMRIKVVSDTCGAHPLPP